MKFGNPITYTSPAPAGTSLSTIHASWHKVAGAVVDFIVLNQALLLPTPLSYFLLLSVTVSSAGAVDSEVRLHTTGNPVFFGVTMFSKGQFATMDYKAGLPLATNSNLRCDVTAANDIHVNLAYQVATPPA